jgi:hypothetical protein
VLQFLSELVVVTYLFYVVSQFVTEDIACYWWFAVIVYVPMLLILISCVICTCLFTAQLHSSFAYDIVS